LALQTPVFALESAMTPDEVKVWRREQRARLLADRVALDSLTILKHREAIDRHLERGFPNLARGVVAFCWPYKNEYDARFLVRRLRDAEAVTALPVVVAPKTPLVFREWHPGVRLERGVYDIPYPAESREVRPDTVLLPMVGFDDAGYRLGYGGAFFDRTLAALATKPLVIGIAYEAAHLDTIHPQPYDVPMDWIVTERGIYRRDGARLEFLGAPPAGAPSALSSPVCYANEVDPGYFGGSSAR
jgi:5,10-methenyltetrahydrofolate synthetase